MIYLHGCGVHEDTTESEEKKIYRWLEFHNATLFKRRKFQVENYKELSRKNKYVKLELEGNLKSFTYL
jgi:NAD-specific glutamate dehydrogenase